MAKKRLDTNDLENLALGGDDTKSKQEHSILLKETEQLHQNHQLINKSFSLTNKQTQFIFNLSMELSAKEGKRISESEAIRQVLDKAIQNKP